MGFWELMIKKDDWIIKVINSFVSFKNAFSFSQLKVLRNMKREFKGKFKSESLFVILNGPSLQKQNLSVLKGKNLMFVNRGFKNSLYKELKPRFHVIIDPKFKNGVWPINWLDEILDMVPDIIFVMPVTWYNLEILKPYKDNGTKFLWIPRNSPLRCLGVSGSCFNTGIFLGFKEIFFTGFDGNGIAYELINYQSHFYGKNEENSLKTSDNYIVDLYMHSRHLNDLRWISKNSQANGVSIFNLTEGGILDMFPRRKLEEVK